VYDQETGNYTLEIMVMDDFSQDDIESVVSRYPDVKLFRTDINIGIVHNFNRCIQMAKYEYIHILHGDDYIAPNFYNEISKTIQETGNVALCCTSVAVVNENNIQLDKRQPALSTSGLLSISDDLLYENTIFTPSVLVNRNTYLNVGSFDGKLSHLADWQMWIRCMLYGQSVYVANSLAYYRVHNNNDSSNSERNGLNVSERFLVRSWLISNNVQFNVKRYDLVSLNYGLGQYRKFIKRKEWHFALKNLNVVISTIRVLPVLEKCRALLRLMKHTLLL
jgi:glycosyltransferase involved in cell wall biosynthesis